MKLNKILSFAIFCVTLCLMVSVNGLANALIFILALFIHEGFHYISAKFFGINLGMPLISPLGLRFEIHNDDIKGIQGALIYLSGAFGNLFFVLMALLADRFMQSYNGDAFIFYNLVFAALNLIPAFPMDASRALCCVLSIKFGRLRAVKITAFISELIAYTFFLFGMYIFILKSDNMILMILATMIFYYSGKEKYIAQESFVMNKLNRLSTLEFTQKNF